MQFRRKTKRIKGNKKHCRPTSIIRFRSVACKMKNKINLQKKWTFGDEMEIKVSHVITERMDERNSICMI